MKRVTGVPGSARRWATLHDAAKYVSCHPRTITRRFGDGTLSRYRMGRKVMVDLDELDAALAATSFTMPRGRRI